MADLFNLQTSSFRNWFGQLPGSYVSSKVSLMDLRQKGAGRGLGSYLLSRQDLSTRNVTIKKVAMQDISEDEELFTLSQSSILIVQNSGLNKDIPEVLTGFGPWISLILVLIYEYLKGDESFWKPYLDVLPQEFNTLMFWSSGELHHFQASAIVNKVGRKEADTIFSETVIPTIQKYEHIFLQRSEKNLPETELMSLAHRMGSIVMAYAFDVEGEESEEDSESRESGMMGDEEVIACKGMIPMADLLNAEASCNAHLQYDEGCFTMRAITNIQAGNEILNDYGPLPRSDLLRRYGYIADSYRQYDVVELPQNLVLKAVQNHQPLTTKEIAAVHFRTLDEHGLLEDAFVLTQNQPVPEQLQWFVEFLLASTTNYDKIFKRLKGRNPKLSSKSIEVIYEAIQERLCQYATTLEDDVALLEDTQTTGRLRMAVEIRSSEKQILRLALSCLASNFTAIEQIDCSKRGKSLE